MLLVNIDYIPGKEFEVLGIVKGTVVQSKNFGKDFMAGMKTLVGGEITGYTEMLNEARQIADVYKRQLFPLVHQYFTQIHPLIPNFPTFHRKSFRSTTVFFTPGAFCGTM